MQKKCKNTKASSKYIVNSEKLKANENFIETIQVLQLYFIF